MFVTQGPQCTVCMYCMDNSEIVNHLWRMISTEEHFQNVPKAHLYETTQTHSYIGEYTLEAHNDSHCG